jgi:phosphatidylinositol alpha-1,6-mannosyltransferase
MPKILYLTTGCFDKGGISRYNRYQIGALRTIAGGENVRVLSVLGRGPGDLEEPFHVDFAAGGVSPGAKAAYVSRTFREAMVFRPDILWPTHVNLSAPARAAASMVPGAKVVLNVYGYEVWSGWRASNRWGWRGVDSVVSDCHATADYLKEVSLLDGKDVEVIWDCVDTEKFFPAPPSREAVAKYGIPDPSSGVNLMTLGRLAKGFEYKGYLRLLEVFSRAAREIPSLRLVFGGGGDLAETLREKALSLGVGDRVFFTGFIHEKDLADVYRSAHLFSLVSDRGVDRGEGIPLTPLEAAAVGTPILVGNQDGSREAVIEGVNGHAFDPFDLKAQVTAVSRLARDAVLRVKMGAAARERIEREFAYPTFVEKHRRLMERWFSDRSPRRAA